MNRRIHPAALGYALEQELMEENEELYTDDDHHRTFLTMGRRYLGSVKRGSRAVHYWWTSSDEELMTITEGPLGVIISGNLGSPLERIPQKRMTVVELVQVGEVEIPSVIIRDIRYLSEMGARVLDPLEFRACDVLLPLLGISILPDSDAEYVDFEQIDSGTVRFYRSPTAVK